MCSIQTVELYMYRNRKGRGKKSVSLRCLHPVREREEEREMEGELGGEEEEEIGGGVDGRGSGWEGGGERRGEKG